MDKLDIKWNALVARNDAYICLESMDRGWVVPFYVDERGKQVIITASAKQELAKHILLLTEIIDSEIH